METPMAPGTGTTRECRNTGSCARAPAGNLDLPPSVQEPPARALRATPALSAPAFITNRPDTSAQSGGIRTHRP